MSFFQVEFTFPYSYYAAIYYYYYLLYNISTHLSQVLHFTFTLQMKWLVSISNSRVGWIGLIRLSSIDKWLGLSFFDVVVKWYRTCWLVLWIKFCSLYMQGTISKKLYTIYKKQKPYLKSSLHLYRFILKRNRNLYWFYSFLQEKEKLAARKKQIRLSSNVSKTNNKWFKQLMSASI